MANRSSSQKEGDASKSPEDRLKKLTDSLRSKNGVDWREAKLELHHDAIRVDFFRGKDFARYFRAKPEVLDQFDIQGGSKNLEDRIIYLGETLLKQSYILKTERKFKKPKPGLKRLVKWPKTLLQVPAKEARVWSETSFYSWYYERPTSPWLYFWSTMMVLTVIGLCLFPLAPYSVKLWVSYISMTLLSILLGLLSVRVVAFGVVWIASGWELWLLPNLIVSEGFFDAFTPVISFQKAKGKMSHPLLRLGSATAIGLFVWFLYSYSPDKGTVRAGAKKAYASIIDFLDLHDPKRPKIAGESDSTIRDNDTWYTDSENAKKNAQPSDAREEL